MTPQIYDHAGRPMSWEEVRRRVAAYYATHGPDGYCLVDPPGSASLAGRLEGLSVPALGTDGNTPAPTVEPDGRGATTGATPRRAEDLRVHGTDYTRTEVRKR